MYLQKPKNIPLLLKMVYIQTFNQRNKCACIIHFKILKNTLKETQEKLTFHH